MGKRFISASIVLVFVLLAAGCSLNPNGQEGTGKDGANSISAGLRSPADMGDTGGLSLPVSDKKVTVSWMLSSDVKDADNKPVIRELEKRTGVKIEIIPVQPSNYSDKIKMILASGKLPDITEGIPIGELNTLGSQGIFVAINQYIDDLPNFKRLYVDENRWVLKSYADDTGNIYTWPVYGLNREVNHGFLFRKDVFDQYGIREWNSTEEFYQALKRLKELFPGSYPYASKTNSYIFRDWSYGWGLGGDATYPMYYDEKSSRWKLATIQPEFKDMISFMKRLYGEGLLDPEFMTDTQDSWSGKMTSDGNAFVTFDWIGRLDSFYHQVKGKNPRYDLRYGNPIGPTGHVQALPTVLNFGTAVANNDKKEAGLKLMDYLTSPSGSELVTMGIRGEEFVLDTAGKPVYPELKNLPNVDISTLCEQYGCWFESMYLRVDKRSVYFNYTEKEKEAQDKIVLHNKFEPLDPVLRFTDGQSSTIGELQAALDKAGIEFSMKYVMEKGVGEAQWNEWVDKAKRLGSDKLEDVYNTAQKNYFVK